MLCLEKLSQNFLLKQKTENSKTLCKSKVLFPMACPEKLTGFLPGQLLESEEPCRWKIPQRFQWVQPQGSRAGLKRAQKLRQLYICQKLWHIPIESSDSDQSAFSHRNFPLESFHPVLGTGSDKLSETEMGIDAIFPPNL